MVEEPMLNAASSYVKPTGLNPRSIYECASAHCDKHFTAETACAFPATRKDGEVHMYFFCSTACYLEAMPAQACARA
jgi:hypothetical protein